MARGTNKLSAKQVEKAAPNGGKARLLGDGGGLFLLVRPGGRSWLYRYMIGGKPKALGLGPFPPVTLAMARDKAAAAAQLRFKDIDPMIVLGPRHKPVIARPEKPLTFAECTAKYIEAKRSGWTDKQVTNWQSTMKNYCAKINDMPSRDIDTSHVLSVLNQQIDGGSFWEKQFTTAHRIRGRIASVLAWAVENKQREHGANPAKLENLKNSLLDPDDMEPVDHHKSMAVTEVPGFMVKLRGRNELAAKPLQFTILTAVRTSETLDATWSEFNLAAKTWTIPAARMRKGRGKRHRKDFTVYLSDAALALLGPKGQPDQYAFSGERGGHMGKDDMRLLLRAMIGDGPDVHGFRTSFVNFISERNPNDAALAQVCLSHATMSKVESAYSTADLAKHRRRIMDAWAEFCFSGRAG